MRTITINSHRNFSRFTIISKQISYLAKILDIWVESIQHILQTLQNFGIQITHNAKPIAIFMIGIIDIELSKYRVLTFIWQQRSYAMINLAMDLKIRYTLTLKAFVNISTKRRACQNSVVSSDVFTKTYCFRTG